MSTEPRAHGAAPDSDAAAKGRMSPAGGRFSDRRLALVLFALSLGIRALVLLNLGEAQPVGFDEIGYLQRAISWQEIFDGPGDLHIPEKALRARSYGEGRWPPLHPMLMALGLWLSGGAIVSTRWVIVLISALTTWIVFGLSRDLAGKQASVAAALLHAIYPTFIAYSHYLWPETTFIFFLLTATWCTFRATAFPGERGRMLYAAGAGLATGLALLTRAPGLPMALALCLWLFFRSPKKQRFRLVALNLLILLVTIAPWQFSLYQKEGKVVFLSTYGGHNLALGNNPWVPEGLGSSWAHPDSKRSVEEWVRKEAERQSISLDQASYAQALDEIKRRPALALRRSLERLRMLWVPDFFPLRHLLHGLYSPTGAKTAAGVMVFVTLAYVLLIGFIARGLFDPRLKGLSLLLALVISGLLLPMLTIGMSRLHLPMLALLLPVAGLGCTNSPVRSPHRRWLPWVLIAAFFGLTLPAWPSAASHYLRPSSHYALLFAKFDRLLGMETPLNDRIQLRRYDTFTEPVEVRVLQPASGENSRIRQWPAEEKILSLILWSKPGSDIVIELATAGKRVLLRPIEVSAWQRWQLTELTGVTWRWGGGEIDYRGSRWPDIDPPSPILGLHSASHGGGPSRELSLSLAWQAAIDGDRDATAYAVAVTRSPKWACSRKPTTRELAFLSDRLVEGIWYGHVCPVDAEGHWGPVISTQPLIIDRTPPHLLRWEPIEVDKLSLHFSEQVRGWDQPGAFRLISPGLERESDTASCASQPRESERIPAQPVARASAKPRSRELRLAKWRTRAPKRYRLLICSAGPMRDLAGNPFSVGTYLDLDLPSDERRFFANDLESGDLTGWSPRGRATGSPKR